MEIILQTNGIEKKYKTQFAVKDVNMQIEQGDIYGFVGENGAGKTTIIRMITGLAEPTKGTFTLFGVENTDTKKMAEVRRRISAVVETPSIAMNMTAYDNLRMQAKLLGLTDLNYIDEVLELTGLGEVRNSKKKVKNFSLGMRQRLGLAIALLGHPDFIILDEPMNGLAPKGIVEIRELILRLNQENHITFLISSHILEELSRMATKYGFLHKGQLIKQLTKEELEEHCRKCLQLELDSVEKMAQTLENTLQIHNFKVLDGNVVRIYDDVDVTKVVQAVGEAGIKILQINTRNESIEEFYLNLMGGQGTGGEAHD